MPNASTVSTQRDPEMLVDVGVDEEPVPDAAEDLQRLAEEERRLAIVVEHEVRQQARRRQHVPDDQDHDEQPELPGAQEFR